MTQGTQKNSRLKRKQQLKRRRIFWTILFMLLGAYAAFHLVNYAKAYFAAVPAQTVVKLESEVEPVATQNTTVTESPSETQESTVNSAAAKHRTVYRGCSRSVAVYISQ